MMAYDQMLGIVQRKMGDHSLEIIKGALDEVLAILKAEGLTAVERKSGIESVVDHLSQSEFDSLTVLTNAITDYPVNDQNNDEG
jgi:magnesium-transporting ATPase (P-type)